jgi:plastocyanin
MKKSRIARSFLSFITLAMWSSCWVATLPVRGASASVSIVDFSFNPSSVTIQANDSVVWNWLGPTTHTSTSDTSLWNSGFLSSGNAQFSHTFSASGSFPYHCTLHPFMTASVTVRAPVQTNVPPTVSITAPTNGAVFAAPWTGTIMAASADSDGTVTQLQFMAGTTVLGKLANPPANASFTVTNLAAGSYTLKAIATDNGGASTTSSGVGITVAAPAPNSLSSAKKSSPTSFQLSYSTTPGLSYVVQRSADLFHWNPLATNSASGSQGSFTDNAASAAANFYRVKLLPNQ